ncbi:hypothetical protein Dimus_036566 [Dionaea muscipula]
MLEKVLKLLGMSEGRVADGFQCLLVTGGSNTPFGTDVAKAKVEDTQLSGSDGEVERQLEFDVSRPSDPEDEEIMVSYKRACDAHVREEQDWQKIASLRLKLILKFFFSNNRPKRKFKKLKADRNECLEASTIAFNQMIEELSNITTDVDMITKENVNLEKWNSDLSQRIVASTFDHKNMSNGCDDLKWRLKDKEEEVHRPRAKKWDMKKDEANLKAHQLENARVARDDKGKRRMSKGEVLQKVVEWIENRRRKLENLLPHQLVYLKVGPSGSTWVRRILVGCFLP